MRTHGPTVQSGRTVEPEQRGEREAQRPACRRIRSADLFAGRPSIVIEHAGDEYRLRITRLGKLILTK